jgi:hypothetical protein
VIILASVFFFSNDIPSGKKKVENNSGEEMKALSDNKV